MDRRPEGWVGWLGLSQDVLHTSLRPYIPTDLPIEYRYAEVSIRKYIYRPTCTYYAPNICNKPPR
jgi:hypothetical protein